MPRSISDNDTRLQAIADCLGIPAQVLFGDLIGDADRQDPALEGLRRAYVAAAEAYNQGIQRKAQSVSLAGTV